MNVFITGCSTGIGLAAAEHFTAKGYQVIATARNPKSSEGLQSLDQSNDSSLVLPLDVTDQASVDTTIKKVTDEVGDIDVLINNAGIGHGMSVENTSIDKAREIMETNYFGAYRMMKAVIPTMRAKGSGTIINISSQAGRRPFFLQGPYCASKYALNGLSETLAHEVAKFGIRVALVEPGVVRTPIFGKNALPEEDKKHYEMLQSRTVRMITKGLLETGCDPIDIAKCMEDIVVSESPKMHYLLEQDARDNIRVYDEDGPEAWIKDGKIEDDDEYFKVQKDRYGYDLS